MTIELHRISKRYDREWVIRDFSYRFESGTIYGLGGSNGSGKSTLLRILAGHLTPSRGRLAFEWNGSPLPAHQVYKQLSICGPYVDQIGELSLREHLRFHFKFKKRHPQLSEHSLDQLAEAMQLGHAVDRLLDEYSSGMRQRAQLGMAVMSHTPLLLLDEPTTTLDEAGKAWFADLLRRFAADRLVIVASNEADDLALSSRRISL